MVLQQEEMNSEKQELYPVEGEGTEVGVNTTLFCMCETVKYR